jgi:uncharacterized protein
MTEDNVLLLQDAHNNKKENATYLKQLSTLKSEKIPTTLIEIHTDTFKKTDCLNCANCCKTTPPIIMTTDVNRISRHLQISSKQFVKTYTITDHNGEMILKVVPCTFLASDNTCTIYDKRPEACRRYPHTDEKEYPKRISLNLLNTLICPAAYNILEKLKKAIPLSS